ncbi:hypothetical protein GQ43DRAFT_460694 [Delitschia confertaspora ATCC 74209]|uniref:Uncharacterized protein n=1 Tax=Delitschia confertaspora ATCC 74209 TaxID=1513339 RepID=A0A9P4JWM0_9PLEO|nr:hypothetical protein GQ43DRAFT_460694 [Delitschia confertaspora ATCC 74209]
MAKRKKIAHESESVDSPDHSEDEYRDVTAKKRRGRKPALKMMPPVNTESQQMLALQSVFKKPQKKDKEIQTLRARVVQNQKGLRDMLQLGMQKVEIGDTRRRNEIATAISTALLPSSPANRNGHGKGEAGPATFPGTGIATNPTFTSILEIIQVSRNLIKEYEKMSEKVESAFPGREKDLTGAWQNDVEHTAKVLEIGHKRALRQIKKVLGIIDVEIEGSGAESDGNELEMVTDSQDLPSREHDLGLHRTLQYAERGIRRLTKGLPEDMEI